MRKVAKGDDSLYISMDDTYFLDTPLIRLIEKFRERGGKYLFIDEVHKYPSWARELKNYYDFYKDVKIVFTGSSAIDIYRQDVDLSRRAVMYEMSGLSFREYLMFNRILETPPLTIEDILANHNEIALELIKHFKPLRHFEDYLEFGYYPFFMESGSSYSVRVEQVVRIIVETDLRFIKEITLDNSRSILKLLKILATTVPFKPNISSLSEKIGVDRTTLVNYLHYLEKARLVNTLQAYGKKLTKLAKPDKLYLENTNIQFALAGGNADRGSMRELFFMNQMANIGKDATLPRDGDFYIDDITYELGGKSKTNKQIANINDSYIVADGIEFGRGNRIPLWLFGMMY
jgi:predicted AAA+ superfamily ATPase